VVRARWANLQSEPRVSAGPRVIITRPLRDARRWLQAFAQHGIDATAMPLIEIRPVSDARAVQAAWAKLPAYTALMFVSASAVDHFFAGSPGPYQGAPGGGARLWATGPGTVAALERHGVPRQRIDAPDADAGQFDSEALWQKVGAMVRSGERVLIVRGSDHDPVPLPGAGEPIGAVESAHPAGVGRDWLAQQLALAGAQVGFVVAYWRAAPTPDAQWLERARAAAQDATIWLFTSGEAIANLLALLPGQDWSHARALATHPRIAQAARNAGFGVVWTSRPALLDVVASIKSVG